MTYSFCMKGLDDVPEVPVRNTLRPWSSQSVAATSVVNHHHHRSYPPSETPLHLSEIWCPLFVSINCQLHLCCLLDLDLSAAPAHREYLPTSLALKLGVLARFVPHPIDRLPQSIVSQRNSKRSPCVYLHSTSSEPDGASTIQSNQPHEALYVDNNPFNFPHDARLIVSSPTVPETLSRLGWLPSLRIADTYGQQVTGFADRTTLNRHYSRPS